MEYKKLMLVTFLLLAIITMGAVSASDNSSSVGELSLDDVLAVDDSQEDLAENPAGEIIASDDELSSDADEIFTSSESLSDNVTVELRDKVDASEDNSYIAYVRDDNSLKGTVTLSIDGTEYYNHEFDGTKSYVFIRDSDLKDFNIADFLGNRTVKLTYNNLSKESVVSFVFEPYFIQPYTVAAREVSYIIFKAPGDFKGLVALYDAVYNNETDDYEPDKLLVRNFISASASEIPLPPLTAGGHVFYVNYTIDGKNKTELFGVYYVENSQNFTSDISFTGIYEGDPVTVTVTGPKEGWIDLYVNGEHKALYSLENNAVVNHEFSDLAIGTHVISISYDGQGYNDLFYQMEFLVTVSNSSQPTIVDNSIDASTALIYGELIITDIRTGEVFKRNISVDSINSSLTNFNTTDVNCNVTEIINQLLNLAQIQAGGKTVTVKNQNVSNSILERYDNRTYTWFDLFSGRRLRIDGCYGTSWLVNVTVIAEYASDSSCRVSFNATGGEGEMADVVVESNSNFTLPECGFTKENRVFYGWNVGDAIKQPGENITVIGDIAIGTVWRYDVEVDIESEKSVVVDLAVDLSTTYIDASLILTDLSTGDVSLINITVGPVKSNYSSPGNETVIEDMINDAVSQLLNLAQLQTGGKTVTVKNQTVSDVTFSDLGDTRIFALRDYYEGAGNLIKSLRILEITGSCAANWTYPLSLEAEYGNKLVNIAEIKVELSKTAFTYNAKVQKPTVTLSNGAVLKEGVDYALKWSAASPKNVGTYSVTVTGIGAYNGTVNATFKINKASNPLAVKAKTANVKLSAVKKKSQTLAVSKVVTFTKKGQGTLTYAKASGNKKITINKKTGKVTVGKGLKKGTYKVKVKIKAAGNANYKASAYKTVTFKIVIK